MGRSRLFTKFPAYPGMNLVILVIPILIVISIALLSGFVTLLIILINIIVAFLYGIAKHRGNVTASLILRFLHGNLLYLGISSFYGLIQVDGMIMIFIGLFDLFVHLSGDLRDLQLDIRANRSTFPTSFGTKPTYLLMIVLNFGSVLFFWNFEIGQNEAFLALILLSLAGWLLFMYCRFSDANYWFHASFHGPKELIYLILGLTYDHEFAANFLIHIFAIVGTLFLWFVSYYSYLWADSRI